jgi:aryl-alcohol dehydrogenase-like predicted oxidoreductase
MASAFDLPAFAWDPLAEGRLTGQYLAGHATGRATQAGRPYTSAGSDDPRAQAVRRTTTGT